MFPNDSPGRLGASKRNSEFLVETSSGINELLSKKLSATIPKQVLERAEIRGYCPPLNVVQTRSVGAYGSEATSSIFTQQLAWWSPDTQANIYIKELGTYLLAQLVAESPSVLSLCRLCNEQENSNSWPPRGAPRISRGKRTYFVPVVAVTKQKAVPSIHDFGGPTRKLFVLHVPADCMLDSVPLAPGDAPGERHNVIRPGGHVHELLSRCIRAGGRWNLRSQVHGAAVPAHRSRRSKASACTRHCKPCEG